MDLYGKLNLRQVDLAITSERSENWMGYDNFTAFTHKHTHSEYAKSKGESDIHILFLMVSQVDIYYIIG